MARSANVWVDLAERVDYLSPMLYPSGFPDGIPGYSDPLDHLYQVIARSLQVGKQLSGLPAIRFRPWLQAFRDYAFDRRRFNGEELHAQINASDANGSNGWMLWNAASRFSLAGLQHQVTGSALKLADVSPKAPEPIIMTQVEQLEGGTVAATTILSQVEPLEPGLKAEDATIINPAEQLEAGSKTPDPTIFTRAEQLKTGSIAM